MALNDRNLLVDNSECSCSGKSPAYTPKMSSFSDADLDCLELLYLAIVNGISPSNELPSYAAIQTLFEPCSCWICMSPRQRKERMVAKMLDMSECWSTSALRAILRLIQAKMTPAQRQAALDCLRYGAVTSVNCDTL